MPISSHSEWTEQGRAGRRFQFVDEPDPGWAQGVGAGGHLERCAAEADLLGHGRCDHGVDAVQGILVRGDDQRQKEVHGGQHELDVGRIADLHRL